MSRNALKILAIIAMTVDHIALVFVEPGTVLYYLMRLFGRIASPIMAFMLAEGFRHTHSQKRYFLRLALFALISQPFYFRMIFGRPSENIWEYLTHWNVMFTLAVTLAALCILDRKMQTVPKVISAAVCISLVGFGDWSFMIPAWTVIFLYLSPINRKTMICYAAVCLLLMPALYLNADESIGTFSFQFGTFLAWLPLQHYDPKKGKLKKKKRERWFFYVYYPSHMVVLLVIRAWLNQLSQS